MTDGEPPPPLILAASDRLARALREDLNLGERDAGLTVWQTPDVRSLRQWIADVWADTWPSAQLLGDTQMQALWLGAVERDRREVISAIACAREAHEAERTAQQYKIDLSDDAAYSDEQRAWRDWRRTVATRMREHDWISSEHLPGIVADGLGSGAITAPAQVLLAGFDATLVPSQCAVLQALRRVTTVRQFPVADLNPAVVQGYLAADVDAQTRFIAEQVRLFLAASDAAGTPPRVVIALPDPDAWRTSLEGALIEWLAPALRSLADDDAARPRAPWRWDSAPALADAALASSLLAVTALGASDNTPEATSRLLLGAWSANPELHEAAAAIDLDLRAAGTLHISVRKLVDLAPAVLREPLERLSETVAAAPRRALPSAWSAHFAERLDAIGWPGVPVQSSAVFQQVQELRRALASLATLDAQTGAVDAARARYWLRETCKRRFEPRAEHTQPVRLIATEDARGIACDLMIVVDADASQFPGAARATPFLPIERQRAAKVPQASPTAWLAHRRHDVAALTSAARKVMLIVPKIDERGGEVTPSPLFDAHWIDIPASTVFSVAEKLAVSGPHTTVPPDDPVPPVAMPESPRGTSGLFGRFAAAPFFAFCTDRLGIEALPEVARGLPAALQGTLVHAALAEFWKEIASRAGLRALTPEQRTERLSGVLSPLLRRHLPAAEFGHALVQLEAARLADVIGAWLAFEANRNEEFRVLMHEKKIEGWIAALPVSLRIDRIEQAAGSGSALTLVDYKTGARVDPNGWREDRLSSPQLPLYATLFDDTAAGQVRDVAFAHVADGAPDLLRWQVWASKGKRPPVVHAQDFPAQCAAWCSALETMATEFLAGRADIDPENAARMRDEPLLALAGLQIDDDAPERAYAE